MGRIVLAVIIGFVVWSALWITAGRTIVSVMPDHFDATTRATDSAPVLMLLIFVSVVVSLVAGWTAAHLARRRAARAARILAGLLLLVGVVVELGGWGMTPAWYHVVFLVLLVPATLAGARLRGDPGR
jgi:hypothetical protein